MENRFKRTDRTYNTKPIKIRVPGGVLANQWKAEPDASNMATISAISRNISLFIAGKSYGFSLTEIGFVKGRVLRSLSKGVIFGLCA